MSERTSGRAVWWRMALLWACVAGIAGSGRTLHSQGLVASRDADGTDGKQGQSLLVRLITVNATHISRRHAIDLLAKSGHVVIQYRVPLLDAFPDFVDVHATNVPLGVALERVLSGTNLRVVPDGAAQLTIVAVQAAVDSGPQVGTIVGRVVDSASGRGVGEATIKVQGTKLSATSSDSGRFTIRDVPVGSRVITIRLFGHRPVTEEVAVTKKEAVTVRVRMVPVANVLSGVVTTATGFQRKVEVGNDITTLNVDSIIQVAPIMTVTDLLETRVPGLTVLHSSGVPGDPSRLRLRGTGSVQGNNDPIVIVDGVRVYASQSDARNNNLAPIKIGGTNNSAATLTTQRVGSYAAPSPLDQIDPNSIEKIEVFKGPSASALYGSDAANGVIVITTKRGRVGPTHWSLNVGAGMNWLPGSWPTNYYRFGYNFTGLGPTCAWNIPAAACTVDSVVAFQALNDPQYSVFTHGSHQLTSLTVSGGVPTLLYSITGSGSTEIGNLKLPPLVQRQYDSLYGPIPSWMVRPDNDRGWGVDGSLTATPAQQVHVTLQSSVHSSMQQRSSLENAITQLEGEYIGGGNVLDNANGNLYPLTTAPLIQNYVEKATDNQLTSMNAVSLSWQPRQWLPLTATAGFNTNQRVDNSYIPYGITASGTDTTECKNFQIVYGNQICDTTGSYGLGRGTSHNQTVSVATAIPLFGQMTVAVGGNLYSEATNDFSVYTDQLAPGVSVPTTFTQIQTNTTTGQPEVINAPSSQSTTGSSTYGVYLQTQIHAFGSLYLNPGFRLDGGSGASTSSGSVGGLSGFPKLDFSYVAVDRQTGRPILGALTLLRPRLAFGLAGTQPAPADKLRLFNISTGIPGLTTGGQKTENGNLGLINGSSCSATITLDGVSNVPAVCLNTLGNTQLRPERTSEVEGGFDAELWRGRVTVTYSQYNKTRHDAVLAIPVEPSVSGLLGQSFNIEKNIGVIRNTGTNLALQAIVLQRRSISWTVGANLSNDNSLVVRLNPGQAPICYGNIFNFPCQGTRVVAGFPLFGEWVKPIASFVDVNHDQIIEPNEIVYGDSAVYVGQPNPKYQLNINTGVTLFDGRLSVNATFAYQNGMTQNNAGACSSGAFLNLPNAPNTPLATQAAVTAAGCTVNGLVGKSASINLGTYIGLFQTVDVFRFNDLSINYQVPLRVSSWVGIPRMALALQGSNLGLHSNYRGKDPGVNAFSTVSAGDETADLGQIPEPRTWWLRLTVGN